MVEAALAIPFMLLCVYGILFFGKVSFTDQILVSAAQETARVAAATPNLNDPSVRDWVRGFSADGKQSNTNAVPYKILAAANLLSNGASGDLPPGAAVQILPWDATDPADVPQAGTISVRVRYPFSLLKNVFTGQSTAQVEPAEIRLKYSLDPSDDAYRFPDISLSERATVAQQIYQEVN